MTNKYKTILTLVIGFLLISHYFDNQPMYYIALSIAISSLISEKLAELVVYIWIKLAEILGWINARIILSIVFYLILTPIAFLSKVFKKEDNLNRTNNKNSLFVEKKHTFMKEDFENVW